MNTHEAVGELVEMARASSRKWYIVAASIVALLVFATLAFIVIWTHGFMIDMRVTAYLSVGVVMLEVASVVTFTRWTVRRRLAAQRPQWIEDLARREGLSAAELESFFTLDSW